MSNGNDDGFQLIAEKTIPDVYTDSVTIELSYFGITMEFGKAQKPRAASQGRVPHVPRVRIHMSPQHAKVMAKLFAKNMRAYEERVGKIQVPEEILKDLDIEEDW